MDTMMTEIQKLKDSHKEKDEQITVMQAQINRLEQQQIKNNIEIKNIPPTQNENLLEIVRSVAKTIKHDITISDITDIYRTRTKNAEKSTIIATFHNYKAKIAFMQNTRAIRPLTIAKINQHLESNDKVSEVYNNNNIFINNLLTIANKQLLWQAKKKAKEEGWKFVWENAGKMFARREERVEALFIQSMIDVNKIKRI